MFVIYVRMFGYLVISKTQYLSTVSNYLKVRGLRTCRNCFVVPQLEMPYGSTILWRCNE